MRSLRGPGGWHSATENPRPAPGEKRPRASETVSPGPEHQRGLLPCLGHSFVLGPSDPFCVTHHDMCCLCHFRFFKHTGTFFFFNQHFKKIPPPPSERADPLPADRPVRLESEAAAGPSPAGTVSLSVYTFLRAIAPRKLSEPGTRPGAVLVTLKFLLQFCQI